jgi:CTP synthase (UTP-ammonia lyase)
MQSVAWEQSFAEDDAPTFCTAFLVSMRLVAHATRLAVCEVGGTRGDLPTAPVVDMARETLQRRIGTQMTF